MDKSDSKLGCKSCKELQKEVDRVKQLNHSQFEIMQYRTEIIDRLQAELNEAKGEAKHFRSIVDANRSWLQKDEMVMLPTKEELGKMIGSWINIAESDENETWRYNDLSEAIINFIKGKGKE